MRYGRAQKILIAVLAIVCTLGILIAIGNRLLRFVLTESSGIGAHAGGINLSLFLIVTALMVLVLLALLIFGRSY